MSNYDSISYRGPNTNYKPYLGSDFSGPNTQYGPALDGYYDLQYLLDLLSSLIDSTKTGINTCSNILSKYSLKLKNDDTDLLKAHDLVYPHDETPGVLTFEEYRYLLTLKDSNAARYVADAYEKSVRGPNGSFALDVYHLMVLINFEARRIKEFIDGYLGNLNEEPEKKITESFQDWAEDADIVLQKIWSILKEEKKFRLPNSELDQLDEEGAAKFQALFQVKLNILNNNIKTVLAQLYKNWNDTSSTFYKNHLGPALSFQVKVGNRLHSQITEKKSPILFREAFSTTTGLNSALTSSLADQKKRNQLFNKDINGILINIIQRDTYCEYIKQLSVKGKALPKEFTEHPSNLEDMPTFYDEDEYDPVHDVVLNIEHSHSELTGRLDLEAHPQYLLRSGGEDSIITGDIYLADGVKIGGIVPSTHAHTGEDGSEKISGSNIIAGTITDENVDSENPSTEVPSNLYLSSQSINISRGGGNRIIAEIGFDVDVLNITGYEFEIVELGSATPTYEG